MLIVSSSGWASLYKYRDYVFLEDGILFLIIASAFEIVDLLI